MKPGRPSKVIAIPQSVLQQAHERIDGGVDTPRDIFDGLNLSRFARFEWFRKYCGKRRRTTESRSDAAADGGRPEAAANSKPPDVTERLVEALALALERGELPAYAIAGQINALCNLRKLTEIELAAERRAAELHEGKVAEMREKLKAAVGAKSADGTKSMTREDVYDLVDQIMRGK